MVEEAHQVHFAKRATDESIVALSAPNFMPSAGQVMRNATPARSPQSIVHCRLGSFASPSDRAKHSTFIFFFFLCGFFFFFFFFVPETPPISGRAPHRLGTPQSRHPTHALSPNLVRPLLEIMKIGAISRRRPHRRPPATPPTKSHLPRGLLAKEKTSPFSSPPRSPPSTFHPRRSEHIPAKSAPAGQFHAFPGRPHRSPTSHAAHSRLRRHLRPDIAAIQPRRARATALPTRNLRGSCSATSSALLHVWIVARRNSLCSQS